jgi:ribosomal protein L24E
MKNNKGSNALVDFVTKISVSIKDWNDRFRNPRAENWTENDKRIYSKNLQDLIRLRDKKLNQSSISALQKIIIINTHCSDLSQSKKIEMIMHFVHNKITSIGYQKIRDIATIMSMLNNSLVSLKNTCDSIADVNATNKAMNELKQYIDDTANNIATEFKTSEKIEGNFWNTNMWLPGRIVRYNIDDGTYFVRYDSGVLEYFVNKYNIRSISKHRANQTKKQLQAIMETHNDFNVNYYARLHMHKEFQSIFQKTSLNDDVVINIMSYF